MPKERIVTTNRAIQSHCCNQSNFHLLLDKQVQRYCFWDIRAQNPVFHKRSSTFFYIYFACGIFFSTFKTEKRKRHLFNFLKKFQIMDLISLVPYLVLCASLVALGFAALFYIQMRKKDEGTKTMKQIALYVRKGAMA